MSEQTKAEKLIAEYRRTKDRNDNPDVFSEWSFLAGRASLQAELDQAIELIARAEAVMRDGLITDLWLANAAEFLSQGLQGEKA